MSLCYVTAFLDLNREKWNTFPRTFDDYFQSFTPHVDMFRKLGELDPQTNPLFHLLVFIDKTHSATVRSYVGNLKNVTIIDIDEKFLENHSVLWRRLGKESEVMNSIPYKNLVQHRLSFPENTNSKYTLINHAKIDFVGIATQMVNSDYFCWVDFGYFSKPENIPMNPLDISRFDKDKINYTIINPLSPEDANSFYTLQNAPERIGGFFFFGSRLKMKEYQYIYHVVHKVLQNIGIVDDDQHIALQCVFSKPELFALHYTGGWHKALTAFQIRSSSGPLKPDLTSIMNRNGSDKGSGHHNYTTYYSKLFEHMREEKLNLLEIGIGSVDPNIPSNMSGTPGGYRPGSSLRGWKEYFENSHIYGCDIDKSILFQEDRISTFHLNQTDFASLREQISSKEQKYDIIVDDGLHHFPTNFFVMKEIFNKLTENGFYIIEDICDFDERVFSDPFLKNIEFKYIRIPNPKNGSDNNIVVARRKGKTIPNL